MNLTCHQRYPENSNFEHTRNTCKLIHEKFSKSRLDGFVCFVVLQCSQTCGREGIKRRAVECKDHLGEIVSTFSCDMDKKPAETMECPQPACTKTLHRAFGIFGLQNQKTYRWRYGGWAEVSAFTK